MMKSILRIGAASLLAVALAGSPGQLQAQTTNKPTVEKKSGGTKKNATEKKKAGHPFRGKLAAVDKVTMSLKVGQSTYYVTSETKITKAGKQATLEDGVVGEPVTGYARPSDDGKMTAVTVRFGVKPEEKGSEKKKAK